MPTPKMTGLLNNCSLNSALPTLLEGIKQLAEREALNTLVSIADNSIVQKYERIKLIFADYYGLPTGHLAFNWRAFNDFLISHSFYANEIIFAPIFRNFIAEFGPENGYQVADLAALRDVQIDGRYNNLSAQEAAKLFHNQLGISLCAYEFVEDRKTATPEDNYGPTGTWPTTHLIYPFGDTPTVNLYLKGASFNTPGHFEIQPHESVGEATIEFNEESTHLPPPLQVIHDGLSGSDSGETSKLFIGPGQLVVYVGQAIMARLDPLSEHRVSAEDYAENGRSLHSDTPLGRQAFAVILLSILVYSRVLDAQTMLENMARLIEEQESDVAAGFLLEQLAMAIIHSRANLNEPSVVSIFREVEGYLLEKSRASETTKELETALPEPQAIADAPVVLENEVSGLMPLVDAEDARRQLDKAADALAEEARRQLAQSAKSTTDEPLSSYAAIKNKRLRFLMAQTNSLVANPTPENCTIYKALTDKVNAMSGWGKRIAGLMLTVLGAALIVGAALMIAGGFGSTLPYSIPVVATGAVTLAVGVGSVFAGIRFFSAGCDKDKLPVSEEAKRLDV